MKKDWYKLVCNNSELQLLGTLNGGQSFRWKLIKDETKQHWIGVFAKKVWLLKQENDSILYKVFDSNDENETEESCNKLLANYFHLDLDLKDWYLKWSAKDPYFKKAAKQFYGIRILRQEITENIFSFICSQNNHISRISSMVEKLAKFYGKKICDIKGETYYSFPEIEELAADSVEDTLRTNGFGYRARYISNSAKLIASNGGMQWLDNLKHMEYEEAKKTLMSLTGVGAKVADCICLMSLGHLEAIPVDTHIIQIASNLYLPNLKKQKTVTEKIYKEIGDHFRDLYGPLAGWAHTVLFCADLKKFQVEDDNEPSKNAKRKKR